MTRLYILPTLLALATTFGAHAADPALDQTIADVGHRWATIYYQTPDKQKDAAYDELITQVQQLAHDHPKDAEPIVWQAIVLSSAAKIEGGLSALHKAKEARELLVSAEAIDPTVMNGSIYASLGSLYAKVPGWPLGFGDKKQAKVYFEKALAIDPHSIDTNYFYADYLADTGDYAKSVEYLQRALAAPPRPGREDADAGRRQEVQALLDTVKKKAAS
ncbi:MAG: TRAP transporter TatT component family protein [Rhodanobacter sp.]|jgi:tetratricopeptide (TPR) repeat protein|nr:TRAP transporter TatT component family protein [Rhodanobacter sp.]